MPNKLKEVRNKAGLTQKQVADAVGIKEQAYQRYEYNMIPNAILACKIAKTLGTTVEQLYGEE